MYLPKKLTVGFAKIIRCPQFEYTPAAGYTASLVLAGTLHQTVNGVADGSDWTFVVTPTLQGFYQATIVVTDINGRVLIESERVEIDPDPTAIPNDTDLRSDAEKIVASITALLKNKATNDQQSMTIAGRQITRYSISELLKLLDYYKAEVSRLKGKTPKAIRYRFGRG